MASRPDRGVRRAPVVALALGLAGCLSSHAGYREARALTEKRLHVPVPAFEDDIGEPSVDALLDGPLTADRAVRIAMLRSRMLRAAFDRVGVARGDLVSALRLPNPEVQGNVRFRLDDPSGEPDVDLGLTVDLREFVLLPVRHAAASDALDAAAITAASDALDVALEVRLAYVEHVAALQSLDLERQIATALGASADLAEAVASAGNSDRLRALNERALAEEAKLRVEGAELEASVTRGRLAESMGLDAGVAWSAPVRLAEPSGDEVSVDDAVGGALDANLELAIASSRVSALDGEISAAAVQGVLPRVDAGVIAERDAEGWAVGPQLSIGLPVFYQGQGESDRLSASQREAVHQSEAITVAIRARARILADSVRVTRRRVELYRTKILPTRADLVDQTQRLYNVMGASAFELLGAKREAIEAGRDYVAALRAYWRGRTQLDLLLAGHLGPMDASR